MRSIVTFDMAALKIVGFQALQPLKNHNVALEEPFEMLYLPNLQTTLVFYTGNFGTLRQKKKKKKKKKKRGGGGERKQKKKKKESRKRTRICICGKCPLRVERLWQRGQERGRARFVFRALSHRSLKCKHCGAVCWSILFLIAVLSVPQRSTGVRRSQDGRHFYGRF